MAHLLPSDLTPLALSLGETAELRTLDLLRRGLPNDYTVYHGVHWSLSTASRSMFGEADFVVVNRSGQAVIIEQKAGALEETDAGLAKRYPGAAPKLVASQIGRNQDAFRQQYARQAGGTLDLDYLFYCPDHRLRAPLGAGLAAGRIVDAAEATALPDRIRMLMGPGTASPEGARVHRFFANRFHLVPDIHAHVREGQGAMARLAAAGLVGAVAAIEMTPLRLRVRGTAGSGKSTVALAAAERAVEAGQRPLVVCFNRPLAEKLRAAAPPAATVTTFHGLLDRFLQARGQKLSFEGANAPGFWARVAERVIEEEIDEGWRFDTLIVDEGQDFDAEWFGILRLFLREGAGMLWLEDETQAIRYGLGPRDALDAALAREGFIGYRTRANYRSPQSIAEAIAVRLPGMPFEAMNPLPGLGVGHHRAAAAEQGRRVGAIVSDLLKSGFARGDVAVLSLKGLGSATLAGEAKAGAFTLRRPTGTYDLLGNQVLTEGQILFDTIHRFKGQQAPAVVLTDVGPPPSDPKRRAYADRVLFAAMTRVTVRLEVVETG